MNLHGLRVAVVGPLAPPSGGMASQTRQLAELMEREGAVVTIVRVNAPYRPAFVAKLRRVRAIFRLVPFLYRLWCATGRADIVHILANSGWSWYLHATPAVFIAKLRGIPSIVNYRGGKAEEFLAQSGRTIAKIISCASALVVPSAFLQQVFDQQRISSEIVPNVVDTDRFTPAELGRHPGTPRLVVARNLEAIYEIETALRALANLIVARPEVVLLVAGSGPELATLVTLAEKLRIASNVTFCGQLNRDEMAELYRSASIVLNPSRVDNMPNSVLEAMASGVPVVSTNVGGVPFILRDGVTGLLVSAGDHIGMAAAVERLLDDPCLTSRLVRAALAEIQQYTWPRVRQRWIDIYAAVLAGSHVQVRSA